MNTCRHRIKPFDLSSCRHLIVRIDVNFDLNAVNCYGKMVTYHAASLIK